MPLFLVSHTAQWTEEVLIGSADTRFPNGVSWKLSYCDFAEGKFFCIWEAPNKKILEQALKDHGTPYDEIYPVRVFNVAKAAIEE